MKLTITGHREVPNSDWVQAQIYLAIKCRDVPVDELIQGMAKGVDQMSALVAEMLGIDVISCRPWATHYSGNAEDYSRIIDFSKEVVVVNELTIYNPGAFQDRNEYMVDRGDEVLAVWDGGNKGGTYNCVRYAQKQLNKDIYWINPVEKEITWLRA